TLPRPSFSSLFPYTSLFRSLIVFASLLLTGACLPSSSTGGNGPSITLYGFSIMKEVLDKEIIPAFKAKWKREHGQDVEFFSSFRSEEHTSELQSRFDLVCRL